MNDSTNLQKNLIRQETNHSLQELLYRWMVTKVNEWLYRNVL